MAQPTENSKNLGNRIEDTFGVIPYIRIHDYIVSKSEIEYLILETKDFLPTIRLKLRVATNSLNETNKLNNGDIIQIGIRTDLQYFKPIVIDVLVDTVSNNKIFSDGNDGNFDFFITGHLWVPNLISETIHFNFQGTAEEALKEGATRIGLGYVENTNYPGCDKNKRTFSKPKETWNCHKNVMEYIKFVTDHQWANYDSFFDSWIDFYYNLVNVNVSDMLGRTVDDDGVYVFTKFRSIVQTAGVDGKYVHNDLNTDKFYKDNKLLMNLRQAQASVWYVTDYKIENNSTQISKKYSTKNKYHIYIQNNGLGQSANDSEHTVDIGVFYNYEKIQLGYTTMNGPSKEDKFFKKADNGLWKDQTTQQTTPLLLPIESTGDNEGKDSAKDNSKVSGNFSKGYALAPKHNLLNNQELEKQHLIVNCNGFNSGLSKGEKVPCVLFRNSDERWMNEKREVGDNTFLFDPIASGWFYVRGMKYTYIPSKNQNNTMSDWRTEITLTRREWFPPEPTSTAAQAGDEENANASATPSKKNDVANAATGGNTTTINNSVSADNATDKTNKSTDDKTNVAPTSNKETDKNDSTPSTPMEEEVKGNEKIQEENAEAIAAVDAADKANETAKETEKAIEEPKDSEENNEKPDDYQIPGYNKGTGENEGMTVYTDEDGNEYTYTVVSNIVTKLKNQINSQYELLYNIQQSIKTCEEYLSEIPTLITKAKEEEEKAIQKTNEFEKLMNQKEKELNNLLSSDPSQEELAKVRQELADAKTKYKNAKTASAKATKTREGKERQLKQYQSNLEGLNLKMKLGKEKLETLKGSLQHHEQIVSNWQNKT